MMDFSEDGLYLENSMFLWDQILLTFFFFATLFFNGRIVALQNFVVFYQISTRLSHRCTHVSSLLNLLPHPTTPDCHGVWHIVWVPWVIVQLPLAGYFTYGHASVHATPPHTSHPLPSPLPLGPQVCFLHLFLHGCPANKFISTIFLDFIYIHQYMILFFPLSYLLHSV